MPRQSVFPITPPDTAPPESRGPLLTPDEVAQHPELFNGKVKAQWVKRNVAPKVKLGHSIRLFYFEDVRAWIASHRTEGAA